MLVQKKVEGFIIAGSRPQKDENSNFLIELSKNYPVVLINSYIRGGNKMYSIMVDVKKASYDALQLLIEKGHRNIFLFGDADWKTTIAKISALKEVSKDNNIPFYVALPSSSIDWNMENGISEIPIEQRNSDEITYIQGLIDKKIENVMITGDKFPVRNFGFDVTPAKFVSGLITERGICKAKKSSIYSLFPEKSKNSVK